MTITPDQPDRESDRSTDRPSLGGGDTAPRQALPRPRRRRTIIAALVGVAAIGLATGVLISLRLDAQAPLAEYDSTVEAVTTAQLDGRTVIITGHGDGTIRVSDLGSGDPVGKRINVRRPGGFGELVTAVATAQLNGRPVIISIGGPVRVWDLATGAPIGQPLTGHRGHPGASLATAQLDGRTAIISTGSDGIRVWDLATGTLIHHVTGGHTPAITAQLDGRTVIISGSSSDSSIRVWDLATGAQLAQHDHIDNPFAMTTAQLNGRTVVISQNDVDGFRVWGLATGDHVSSPLPGDWQGMDTSSADSADPNVRAVTTTQLDGRTVIISGDDDGMVRVWDLATSTPIGAPLDGHLGTSVSTAATAQMDERTVIISGGYDGTVRAWDLGSVRR